MNEAKFCLPPLGLAGDPVLDLHTDIIILYIVRKPLLMTTSFPGFSPTRRTEQVEENPWNEVVLMIVMF